jgi:hypothetical protein
VDVLQNNTLIVPRKAADWVATVGIIPMADSILGCVIEYLASDDLAMRDIALNWLCEGYIDEPLVTESVFEQWHLRSAEQAFTQFPLLGYFPVSASQVNRACEQAEWLIGHGGPLTSSSTRCAGKLIEQLILLPPRDLAPHVDRIAALVKSHKIFFRVDLQDLQLRIDLLGSTADLLFETLESAIKRLVDNPQDGVAGREGQRALESLRYQYPDHLDLGQSLRSDSSLPQTSISRELTLASLCHIAGEDSVLEPLGDLLDSSAQSVVASSVEALVRSGTGAAAQVLVDHFSQASAANRPWIARGLQRMRVHNLAPLIAALRDRTSDERLQMMLYLAELQQLDPNSGPRMIQFFDALDSASPDMLDAGMLYTFVCGPLQESTSPAELEESYRDLLVRIGQSGQAQMVADQENSNGVQDKKTLRKHQGKQIRTLFKKRTKP